MDKRGDTHEVLWWVINLFFVAIIVLSLVWVINSFGKNNFFERRYLAKDIALTVNNIYASPNSLIYVYTENDFYFDVLFTENQVRVIDPKEGDLTARKGYFIEDGSLNFNYKRIKSSVVDDKSEEEDIGLLALGFRKSPGQIDPSAIIRTSEVLNNG